MASQVLYFLIEFSESTKRSFSEPNEIFQCLWGVRVGYKRKISHWNDGHYLQSSDEKRVVDIRHRLDSAGLAQEQEKTLCLGNMRTSAYLLLFPVNKSHRQFYDSWKIDDPEPRPWNRQLQNSCRPDDEKRFHVIFIALMLVVNLYIFCNGMESFSKNKKKQSICNLFYRFLKGFLDKIELW